MRYIALLRGINVGGNTMIKMTELKAAFEKCGFEHVVTYINSGNLAFDITVRKPARSKGVRYTELTLVGLIERAIEKDFGKTIPVMVREQRTIIDILANNPFDGEYESHKEMHVLFLREPMPADKSDELTAKSNENERFVVRGREIYCHLRLGVALSLLGKGFIEKKLKVPVTARNWRTVQKLAEL